MIFWRDNIQKNTSKIKWNFMKYCEKKCIDPWLLLRCDQILNGQKLCIKETWLFCGKVSLYNEVARRCDKSPDSINRYLWPFFGCCYGLKNFKNVEYLFLEPIWWFNRSFSHFDDLTDLFYIFCKFSLVVPSFLLC